MPGSNPINTSMIDVYIYGAICLATFLFAYIVFSIFTSSCKVVYKKVTDLEDKKNSKRK